MFSLIDERLATIQYMMLININWHLKLLGLYNSTLRLVQGERGTGQETNA